MRLIDADELWERLKKSMVRHIVTNTLFNTVKATIDGTPTVEAEQVIHGKWERSKEDGFDPLVKCTACGEEFVCTELDIIDDLQWNYCPTCGAKMDKQNTAGLGKE